MLALVVAATGGAMSPAAPVLASQFPSLHNLRDLGGTPCGGANCIAPARVLRSASPADVSQEDFNALLARLPGLRVVDLRSQADALEDEGVRLLADRTEHVELLPKETGSKRIGRHVFTDRLHITLPLLPFRLLRSRVVPSRRLRKLGSRVVDAGVRRFLDSIELSDVYWWILMEEGGKIRTAIEMCASEGPTLLHCAHGKDRTGVVSALLLHICGASTEAIAADYVRSDEWGCSAKGQVCPSHAR